MDIYEILEINGYKDVHNIKRFSPNYERELTNIKNELLNLIENELDPSDECDFEDIKDFNERIKIINIHLRCE
jgi:hypothetical protein